MARTGVRAPWVLIGAGLLAAVLAGLSDELAPLLTRRVVLTAKAVLATAAVAVLWWGRRATGSRLRAVLLTTIAAASACAWWSFFQFHYPHFFHVSDSFHYYVGSKYFDELGYTRLYDCVAVADAEQGEETGVRERDLRDLATNRIVSAAAALGDPAACKSHFSGSRWEAFRDDVSWFRARVSRSRWHAMQRDHGYNATPVWTLLGGWLANRAPASEAQILALVALDPMLLVAMWAVVGWAFGGEVLAVALIFWGTNPFGEFGWNGGSVLRQTWLASAVIGVACLYRGRAVLAGFLLGVSAALRIFPATILAGGSLFAAREVRASLRTGAPLGRTGSVRLAAGGALALALVLGSVAGVGVSAWPDFVRNSAVHLATPLKNHVGLRTLRAWDPQHVDRREQSASAV